MTNTNNENSISTEQIWVGILFIVLITGGMIIADTYWRTKYETRCEVGINIQSDLDRIIDLMEEEKNYRNQVKGVNN